MGKIIITISLILLLGILMWLCATKNDVEENRINIVLLFEGSEGMKDYLKPVEEAIKEFISVVKKEKLEKISKVRISAALFNISLDDENEALIDLDIDFEENKVIEWFTEFNSIRFGKKNTNERNIRKVMGRKLEEIGRRRKSNKLLTSNLFIVIGGSSAENFYDEENDYLVNALFENNVDLVGICVNPTDSKSNLKEFLVSLGNRYLELTCEKTKNTQENRTNEKDCKLEFDEDALLFRNTMSRHPFAYYVYTNEDREFDNHEKLTKLIEEITKDYFLLHKSLTVLMNGITDEKVPK